MNLVAVEAPAVRMALTRETLELLNATFGIITACHRLQVVTDELIEALPERFRLLAGTGHELVIDGEGDVHKHSICGHGLCVNIATELSSGEAGFRRTETSRADVFRAPPNHP